MLDDGDDFGAAVFLTDAIRLHEEQLQTLRQQTDLANSEQDVDQLINQLEETVQAHRLRLACVLEPAPRIRHMWRRAGLSTGIDVSSDGARVVAVFDHGVAVFDVKTGETIWERKFEDFPVDAEFHPDGKRVATLTRDTAVLWDIEADQPQFQWPNAFQPTEIKERLIEQSDFVRCVFNPDGSRFVAITKNQHQVYDTTTGKLVFQPKRPHNHQHNVRIGKDRIVSFGHAPWYLIHNSDDKQSFDTDPGPRRWAEDLIVSRDGEHCVTLIHESEDRTFRLRDMKTLEPVGPVLSTETCPMLQFGPHDNWVVFASSKMPIRNTQTHLAGWVADQIEIVDPMSGDNVGPTIPWERLLHGMKLSPDGRLLALRSANVVEVWNLKTGLRAVRPLNHLREVRWMGWTKDGRALLTSSQGFLRVWDIDRQPLETTTVKHDGPVQQVQFIATGAIQRAPEQQSDHANNNTKPGKSRSWALISAGDDGLVRMTDTTTNKLVQAPFEHGTSIASFSISPTQQHLVSIGERLVNVWNFSSGRVGNLEAGYRAVQGQLFDNDKKILMANWGILHIFDSESGGEQVFDFNDSVNPIYFVQFTDDKRHVFTATIETVRRYDLQEGRRLWRTDHNSRSQYDGEIKFFQVMKDEQRYVVCNEHGAVVFMDCDGGKYRRQFQAIKPSVAAISPDERLIVIGSPTGLTRVWDLLAKGNPVVTPPLEHKAKITAVAFSPPTDDDPSGGRYLLTCSEDGTARIWNVNIGEPVTPAFRHDGAILDGVFSPDGRHVATAGSDGVAKVWTLPKAETRSVEKLIRDSRIHSSRYLDDGIMLPLTAREIVETWTQDE